MQRSNSTAFFLWAYVLAAGFAIEILNSAFGNVLPGWHEHAWGSGSGYGKMRGAGDFQDILILLGTWVYPAAIVAAILFCRDAWIINRAVVRVLSMLAAASCLAVLARFMWLGVWSAGAGAVFS